MKLSSVGLGAIQELLNIENSITSVSSWPFWIVSSYFDFYPEEIDKFSAYTFIVENEKEWEIIIIRNKEYVCYRRGNIENFDKKTETENSIKFIVQNFNIDPNDVVICAISDKTISSFIQSSTIDMNIISNSVSFDISHEPNNLNKIAKILCSIIFFGISLNMISDIFKIRSYGEKIENAENTISLIDPNMVKEIATWENINESDCLFKPDFKSALRKKTSELGQKLQNVSMEVDDKTKEIILKTIYDEN
jgi:hypothetical protein